MAEASRFEEVFIKDNESFDATVRKTILDRI